MSNDALSSLHKWDIQRFSETESREGALAIFMERPTTACVVVNNISADDWGVNVDITCVPSPGMRRLGEGKMETCHLSSAWQAFSFSDWEWSARYVAWKLLFDPKLIARMRELGIEAAAHAKEIDYAAALRCVSTHRAEKQGSSRDGAIL